MSEKRFDIADIITAPVNDPIPIWGSLDMTCAELYNSLWERFCWESDFYCADEEKLKDELMPLARYLAAILYERWSRSSDIAKEDELQKLIDRALEENDLSNAPFASYRPWFTDHNEDDFIFNPDDKLSNWLGEQLSNVAANMSGFSFTPHYHDIDKDFIWMVGERPGEDPRPCFKASGWDIVVDDFISETSILRYPISSGIEVVVIERDDVRSVSWGNDLPVMEVTSMERLHHLRKSGKLDSDNTKVLVVDNDDWAHVIGSALSKFLEVMELIPENTERFLVLSCEQRSWTNLEKVSEIVKSIGLEIYCAPNDDDDILGAALHDVVGTKYTMRSTYQYKGGLPEHIASKFDDVLAYFEVYNMMESMLYMPVKRDVYTQPTALGCGSEPDDDKTEEEEIHPDRRALDYISGQHSLKTALFQGYGASRLAREFSFGMVENLARAEKEIDKVDSMFDWTFSLIHNIYEDSITGGVPFTTPKLDALKLAHELYRREGAFYDSSSWYPTTIYDTPYEDGEYDEYMDVFSRRVSECVSIAEKAGAKSSIEAFLDGVPADDILA